MRPAFQGCGNYQVFSQFDVESGDPFAWFLPQHYTLPLLYEHYPNATWILNTRETPERWATNVLHWYSVTSRILHSFGLEYHDYEGNITIGLKHGVTNQRLYRELDKGIERAHDPIAHQRRHAQLTMIYKQHSQKVKEFSRRFPSLKLVEINVDDPQAGVVLSQAFPSMGARCWHFDAAALDNDWQDFSFRL